jgi:hypothetical protein
MLFNPRLAADLTAPRSSLASRMDMAHMHPLEWFKAFETKRMDDHLPAPPQRRGGAGGGAAPAAAAANVRQGARAGAGAEPPAQRPRRV